MLGFTQSGSFFRIKTRALTKHLHEILSPNLLAQYPDGLEFAFPDAPVRLHAHDVPGVSRAVDGDNFYAWARSADFDAPHPEIPSTIAYLANYVRSHGPFDGIIGFSQGACAAMILASYAECSRGTNPATTAPISNLEQLHPGPEIPPFKFAIAISGFRAGHPYHDHYYTPRLLTPTLHVIAALDTFVSAERSAALVDTCANPEVIIHHGSHYVPTEKRYMTPIATFIDRICGQDADHEEAFRPVSPLPVETRETVDYFSMGGVIGGIEHVCSERVSTPLSADCVAGILNAWGCFGAKV